MNQQTGQSKFNPTTRPTAVIGGEPSAHRARISAKHWVVFGLFMRE
jgi:hypothetical protein